MVSETWEIEIPFSQFKIGDLRYLSDADIDYDKEIVIIRDKIDA